MFDGFWSGIFGGLFGTAIAQYLSRFKYWMIFFVAVVGWQSFFFIMATYYKGWSGLRDIFVYDRSSFLIIFIYIPIGAGLLAVIIGFLGSLNNKNKLLNNGDKKSGNS